LNQAAEGHSEAADQLLLVVYAQLRKLAQQQMAQERTGHTLQATALVHEAYLRLVGDVETAWDGRAHFFSAAAEAMRRLLIEHARKGAAKKRGGGRRRESDWLLMHNVADLASSQNLEDVLALDEAIQRLEKDDPQAAAVVRLRFFAGLDVELTAQALGISPRTVKRDWAFARTYLFEALNG
jgi:RNA polymerase sigma factor (TIGR02999 family)